MWTTSKAILVALLVATASQLYADGINNPKGGGTGGGDVGFVEGINNLGIGGSGGGGGGCTGTIDLSKGCTQPELGLP